MNKYNEAREIMLGRFGKDNLLSVATMAENRPSVRIVNAYYEDGAFYAVTYALSNKMKHIVQNPEVAVCGEWFQGHGMAENLGHVRAPQNTELMARVRAAFAEWYDNGHTSESDPNTCILRIRMTDGVLYNQGTKYILDFENATAT